MLEQTSKKISSRFHEEMVDIDEEVEAAKCIPALALRPDHARILRAARGVKLRGSHPFLTPLDGMLKAPDIRLSSEVTNLQKAQPCPNSRRCWPKGRLWDSWAAPRRAAQRRSCVVCAHTWRYSGFTH